MALFSRSKGHSSGNSVTNAGAVDVDPVIIDRVAHAHLELIPTPKAHLQIDHLPAHSTVSVTASPAKDLQATLDLAAQLIDRGHTVIPHLAARMVTSRDHVTEIATWFSTHGVRDAFIIGGDAAVPHGPYPDGESLVAALLECDSGINRIGFGGYPDGHIAIPTEVLDTALTAKQELLRAAGIGGWVSTQMCFDPRIIENWLADRRAAGLDLPVHLGVPGVIDTTKLLTMGVKLGIGASLRFLRKNRTVVSTLAAPGGYDPMVLLEPLAAQFEPLGITALHMFTFNQVANTVAWQQAVGGGPAFLDHPAGPVPFAVAEPHG